MDEESNAPVPKQAHRRGGGDPERAALERQDRGARASGGRWVVGLRGLVGGWKGPEGPGVNPN